MRSVSFVAMLALCGAALTFASCTDDDRPPATTSSVPSIDSAAPRETAQASATPSPAATMPRAAEVAADARLRLVDTATGDSRPLGIEVGRQRAWSPDGTTLAVAGNGVSVVGVARGSRASLWHETSCGAVAWSPDATHLAAICADGMITFNTSGVVEQRDDTVPADWVKLGAWVRWSPDGTWAVYGATNTQIRALKSDGARAVIAGAFVDARWLADGRLVAVEQASYRDAATVRVHSGAPAFAASSQFTTRAGAGPIAVDRNGRYAAYAAFAPDPKPTSQIFPSTVFIVGLDTGKEVTSFADAYGFPDLSREGTSVLIQQNYCGKDWAMIVGSLDGKTRIIAQGGAFDAKFSPDGSQVGFTRGIDLWVVASDGATPARKVASGVHGPAGFEWSPDSRSISIPPFFGGYGQCP